MSASGSSASERAEPDPNHRMTAPVCDRCGVMFGTELIDYDEVVVCDDDETCWISVQMQTVLSVDGHHSTGLTAETMPRHIYLPAGPRR